MAAPSAVSRRSFLSMSLRSMAACAVATLLAPIRRVFAGAAAPPRCIRRIVTGDNRTSTLIEWQSDARENEPAVLWRERGKGGEKAAPAEETRLKIEGRTVFLYRATLFGLSPGKTYEYRLRFGRQTTEPMIFRTDDGVSLRALVFPDSQCEAPYNTWERVARAGSAHAPEADLWINLGDLVDNGESSHHWEGWQAATDVSLGQRAFAPVMGNHECYSLSWEYALPRVFLELFSTPPNGSAKYDRYYYSFDYGPVHFTVLNTQHEELADLAPGLFEEQAAWLARDLAGTKKPWRVVLMHRDLVNYDETPPVRDTFVETLVPIIEAGGADAVLTAHAHAYRRRRLRGWEQDKNGVLYILSGNAGNCFYEVGTHPLDEIALPSRTLNYLELEASKTRLAFRCFLPNGIEKDFVTLRKQPAMDED